MRRLLITAACIILPLSLHAQKWSVSTDLCGWADLGTVNAGASVAAARHVTVDAYAAVNPWTFRREGGTRQFQKRHQTYAAGMRWWYWNVYSGWWTGCGVQYREYNRGGIRGPVTREGDAAGLYLSAGWSLMLHPHINLDLGLGGWTGWRRWKEYACPRCGRITGEGSGWFVLPDRLTVALMFTF